MKNVRDFFLPDGKTALVFLGIVLVIGALNAYSSVADYLNRGGDEIWQPIVWDLSSVLCMGLLIQPVYYLTRAFPFNRNNWRRRVVQHLGLSLLYSMIHTTLMVLLRKAVYQAVGSHYDFGNFWVQGFYELTKDLITYLALVLTSYGFLFWNNLKQQQLRALSLERAMSDLKLRRLQEQLQPHFLFNTLNLISSCMYEDVEKADRLMADLAGLLRYSLQSNGHNTVPVGREVHFLRRYLDLVNARFDQRIEVNYEVTSAAEAASMPRFLLQPLAENAIQHGFQHSGGKGQISLVIARQEDRLRIELGDNGCGSSLKDPILSEGMGLRNTLAALELLYPQDHLFQLKSNHPKGTLVVIELPYQVHEGEVPCAS